MAARIIQERVKYLHKKIRGVPEIPLSDRNEVSDEVLAELNIRRISFDPEHMHIENFNRSQNPPILFQAMTPEELARYPLRSYDSEPGMMDYPEYNPALETQSFTYMIAQHIDYYAVAELRENIPRGEVSLLGVQGLHDITVPNDLLRHTSLCGYYFRDGRFWARWSAQLTAEPLRVHGRLVYPHLTLGVTQESNGDKNTILYGELAPIVDAMHARAVQTVVPEEEQEALFETAPSPPSGPPAFSREERFPVLILSFVGPHHGRVLYACMDDTELVIRQSRLYDFRSQSTAPVDLFARLYLSRPLSA